MVKFIRVGIGLAITLGFAAPALAMMAERAYDLVLADIRMPALREHAADIPLIADHLQ